MSLSMLGIEKSFGANNVLRGVDFSVGNGEIRALIASAAEVIAMRWHALLFASESGVPFYTVAGDFKTESFLREKHREDCILLTTDPPYLTSS